MTVDLDGVLVDAAARRRDALIAAFVAEGLANAQNGNQIVPATLDASATFDELVRDCIAAPSADPDLAAIDETGRDLIALRAEREDRARISDGVTLLPRARDAIIALTRDFRVAIVTPWRRADVERVLALAELDVVRFVVAGDDGPGFASALTRYRRAVDRLRRAPPAGVDRASPIVALVAGARGADAARAARATPLVVGADVLITELTPARVAIAASVAQPEVLVPPPLSRS